MRAVVRDRYGPPDVVELQDVDKPAVTDDGVLVRVRAASVNRADWYMLKGPLVVRASGAGLRKPKERVLGVDFAGTVEAVGKDVSDLQPGDDVFGGRSGALAEYVNVRKGVARKPDAVSFEEAAAVPVAALTALQGLRDKGRLRPGQKVLVNGASGGVGVYAVQVAKALGAEVTAVCSTRNVDQARELGADRVIDYTREDFTQNGQRYDVLFDVAGSRSYAECRRVLARDAIIVKAGAPSGGRILGPLGHIARFRLAALRGSQKVVFFIAKFNREDMNVLRELLETGKLKPVIEKTYELGEAAEALRYMGTGHVRSKLVIRV